MKIKKLISLLICGILILISLPAMGAQSDSLIASVSDGDIIYNSMKDITLNIEPGCDTTIILDGEKICNFVSEGNDTVALGKDIEAGKHTLTVVAVADDILSQTVGFTLAYKGLDTSAIYADEATVAGRGVSHSSGANAGTDSNGSSVKLVRSKFEGIDGTTDGAFGFTTTAPVANASGAAEIYIDLYWSGKTLSGVVEVEYDILIDGKIKFEFETAGGGKFGNIGPNEMITNGKVANKNEYVPGEWFHMKHIVDLNNAKQDLYMNDELLISGSSISNATSINTVKIQARAEASDVCSKVVIDNFSFGNIISSDGVDSVSYSVADELENVENGVVTKPTNFIRLATNDGKAGNAKVTVYADGKVWTTLDSTSDSDGNIGVLLPSQLPCEADIKIVADMGSYLVFAGFKTAYAELGIKDVGFETSDGKCYIAKELLPGTELYVPVTIVNNSEEERSALVIAAIYNGNRLSSITAKNMILTQDSTNGALLELQVPYEDGEYTAECYVIDNFAERNILSKIYVLD